MGRRATTGLGGEGVRLLHQPHSGRLDAFSQARVTDAAPEPAPELSFPLAFGLLWLLCGRVREPCALGAVQPVEVGLVADGGDPPHDTRPL
jgi:hypothetical protein